MHDFQYSLEENLYELFQDLNNGRYRHGGYRKFIVCDNKRREISVASVRDRVVHRLIYDYLEKIYDKTFIYDAWSCRKGKGLLGAISRINVFLKPFPPYPLPHTHNNGYSKPFNWVWKCDVKKFFDSVNHQILLKIISLRIKDSITLNLLQEVIASYTTVSDRKVGMPIGNLTSQIFANIYLNELDRFVKHQLKPHTYVRYGDDFIVIQPNLEKLKLFRIQTTNFLNNDLKLQVNPKSDKIIKTRQGLKLLGIKCWSSGRTLNNRNLSRIKQKLASNNVSSYSGLIKKHGNKKQIKHFNWLVHEKLLADL